MGISASKSTRARARVGVLRGARICAGLALVSATGSVVLTGASTSAATPAAATTHDGAMVLAAHDPAAPDRVATRVPTASAGPHDESNLPAAAAPLNYVALGDSYTAGPLIPDQTLDPLGCLRSTSNWAQITAAALGLKLTDMSCSGATTADMKGAQSTAIGTNPPQLSAVNASTNVVTLGIGGNDIGFVSIIEHCAAILPIGHPCKNKYVHGNDNELLDRIEATAPLVGAVLMQIRAAAPKAKVFVVGYPDILPQSGGGCWPSVPFAPEDLSYLRQTEVQLNAMLASEAKDYGDHYVDTYTPSIGHDACQPESKRWVEPLVPESEAAPFHPNARGMSHLAPIIESAMTAAGV